MQLLPSQGVYDHEDHPVERRSWWWTIVGVAVDSKAWQQWLIREKTGAENIDGNGNQDVRDDEQCLGQVCYAMLRALHLLRCVAQGGRREGQVVSKGQYYELSGRRSIAKENSRTRIECNMTIN